MAGFSIPIPKSLQPRFAEGTSLASNRDDRNNSKLWKKNKTSVGQLKTDGNALALLQRQVASMRRVKSGGFIAPAQDVPVLPFQIYNIDNLTDSKDTWRTFQIRDGFVSGRSKYWKNQVNNAGSSPAFSEFPVLTNFSYNFIGNFESAIPVFQDGEGFVNDNDYAFPSAQQAIGYVTAKIIELAVNADTLISGCDATGTYFNYAQIVLPKWAYNSSSQYPQAAFWIEIVDHPTNGFVANLYGRMYGSPVKFPHVQTEPFPSDNAVIPLGCVIPQFASTDGGYTFQPTGVTQFYQYQVGNCVNRFPAMNKITGASNAIGELQCFRVNWIQNSLSGQVFYPGDSVYDDTSTAYLSKSITGGGGGTFTFRGIYSYIGNAPAFKATAPHSDSTNWFYRGAVI